MSTFWKCKQKCQSCVYHLKDYNGYLYVSLFHRRRSNNKEAVTTQKLQYITIVKKKKGELLIRKWKDLHQICRIGTQCWKVSNSIGDFDLEKRSRSQALKAWKNAYKCYFWKNVHIGHRPFVQIWNNFDCGDKITILYFWYKCTAS